MKTKPILGLLPILLTLTALAIAIAMVSNCGSQRVAKEDHVNLNHSSNETTTSHSGSSTQLTSKRLPSLGPARRAPDFPHSLKTFRNWEKFSVEELKTYRPSLISRVGRWDAGEVSRFFFESDPKLTDPLAKREFRQSILGVWCAKNVDQCIDILDETFTGSNKHHAMQDALGGWAQEDWMTALQYLRRRGDRAIEARLGGNATHFITALIRQVALDNGIEESAEVAASLRSPNNQKAANQVIAELRKKEQGQ